MWTPDPSHPYVGFSQTVATKSGSKKLHKMLTTSPRPPHPLPELTDALLDEFLQTCSKTTGKLSQKIKVYFINKEKNKI